jgi:cobalt/nickel transport system permease protein
MKQKKILVICIFILTLIMPKTVFAMHIMEGFLPPTWSIFWGIIVLPFFVVGIRSLKKIVKQKPKIKIILSMAGAFVFVLSSLKIPSITGSCSHPTGVGLGAILFGPTVMTVIGVIVLLFQAILLAHGGLTTLGANAFSMAVVGPLVAYALYRLFGRLNMPKWFCIAVPAALGNLSTYVVTAFQLAVAFPSAEGGIMFSLTKFMSIFAVTQIPLAVSEGILTLVIYNAISSIIGEEMEDMRTLQGGYNNE